MSFAGQSVPVLPSEAYTLDLEALRTILAVRIRSRSHGPQYVYFLHLFTLLRRISAPKGFRNFDTV